MLFSIAVIIAALIVIVIFKQQSSSENAQIKKLAKKFFSCLPEDLTKAQKAEVRSTLKRFQKAVDEEIVAENDRKDAMRILEHYVKKGSISKKELQVFLAKVDYYTIRLSKDNLDDEGKMKPPDHPLLMNSSSESDSVSRVQGK